MDTFRPLDPEKLTALAGALVRGAQIEREYAELDPAWMGAPGSQAERERYERGPRTDAWWTAWEVSTAYASSRLQLVAAADHMVSLARLLPTRVVDGTITPFVIARSVIETAARAWWVVDPQVSAEQRVARGCAEQLYSAHQAERLAQAMGLAEGVAGIAPDLGRLRARVIDLGFTVGVDAERPCVGTEQRQRPTQLISDFLGGTLYRQYSRGVYPLYSAVATGRTSA